MQAEVSQPDTKNQVGKFTFTVVVDQNTPHDQERLARRSEVIAKWILDRWDREQRQHQAERK